MVWDLLEKKNVVTFPRPIYGRIPNFVGANVAAEKLDELRLWRKARVIKSNPDSPQKWVREKALRQGKTVYMAVPRLREEKCFLKIDPKKIIDASQAATIKGGFRYGKQVFPDEINNVDLVVVGSVAVNKKGAKVGKGGGFSDLEYAIGRELGIVDESTPVVTTVHQLQLLDHEIPMEKHDVPVDYILTHNGEIVETIGCYPKPKKVHWDIVGDKIKEIPVLL
ncbi:MAG TPA: 5-formyltetrahydrofolate cyclo-ligase [Thermoplasmatales archaeon]|nr:5-formyltetrahydrofolate cyclo-ligase [Thermoplasmatales archaeon]